MQTIIITYKNQQFPQIKKNYKSHLQKQSQRSNKYLGVNVRTFSKENFKYLEDTKIGLNKWKTSLLEQIYQKTIHFPQENIFNMLITVSQ